jgi:hypothetical protein
MKKTIIFSIGFICGAALGGAASYLYWKKKYNERFEEDVHEEISKFKEEFEPKHVNLFEEIEKEEEKEAEIEEKREKHEVKRSYDVKKSAENLDTNKVDYAKLIRQLNGEEFEAQDVQPETEEQYRERVKEEGMITPPYKISADDFEDDNGYEKKFIMYYEKSDVFADSDDVRLNFDEISDMIGPFTTDDFGAMGDYGLMYVRNEQFGIDYQVELDDENEFDGLEW